MVEKASIEDVMKVLMASRKQDMHQLWTTCSHLVAKSGLPPEVLAKHLPFEIVAKIEELRLKSPSFSGRSLLLGLPTHRPFLQHLAGAGEMEEENKIHRMRRALDSSDVELVKLMVMGEGLNLDEALALHYAVQYCSREVAKALLELGAADVNAPAGPTGKTPLHLAAEMVNPDMVAVLLDHHADPTARTVDGVTPLDVLRTLTSDYLFKGTVQGLAHLEPNKLRLCLELVQSAAMVMSRENDEADAGQGAVFPARSSEGSGASNATVSLNLDSRMVYLNLGCAQLSCKVDGNGNGNGNGDSPDSNSSRRVSMSRHESHGYCDPSTLYSHHEY